MNVDGAILGDEFVDVSTELGRRVENGTRRLVINQTFDSPELRDGLNDPNRLLAEAKLVKDSRTTTAGVASLADGRKVFIKRHNDKGLFYGVRHLFRPSRPFRACRAALTLETLGVPTPTPLAASAIRRHGLLRDSYLIVTAMERLIPTLDFYDLLASDESIKDDYLDAVANIMTRIHEGGLIHGDLKLSNVYVVQGKPGDDPTRSYGVCDLDATRPFKAAREPTAITAELARFASSFIEIGERGGRSIEPSSIVNQIADRYRRFRGIEVDEPRILVATMRFLNKRPRPGRVYGQSNDE